MNVNEVCSFRLYISTKKQLMVKSVPLRAPTQSVFPDALKLDVYLINLVSFRYIGLKLLINLLQFLFLTI